MQDKFEENIKNSLQNHEMEPPPMAWENISAALQKEKPNPMPWAKWMGIAAALMIPTLLAIGFWFANSDNVHKNSDNSDMTNDPSIVKSTSSDTENDLQKSNTVNSSQQNQGSTTILDGSKYDDLDNNRLGSNPVNDKTQFLESSNRNTTTGNRLTNFMADLWNGKDSALKDGFGHEVSPKRSVNMLTALVSPFRNNVQPAFSNPDFKVAFVPDNSSRLEVTFLNATEDKKIAEDKNEIQRKSRKFEFSPYVGTAYLGSFNEASLISPAFNQLKIENPLVTSYGAKAAYHINDDLKLRAGVGMIDMRQHTYDVPMTINSYNGAITYNLKSYSNVGVDLSDYNSLSAANSFSELEGVKSMRENISQDLQFIEVPLEVEYKLTHNKKMNFAATGGMSTMFLNKNDVYLRDQNAIFAKSTNMKSVSFSANAGVKLNYELTDKISVNVEPQMKYMINTVTSNSELQPYMLAVNAGLSLAL